MAFDFLLNPFSKYVTHVTYLLKLMYVSRETHFRFF